MKQLAKELASQLPKQTAKEAPSNLHRYFKLARVPGAPARAFPSRPDPYPYKHFGSVDHQTNPTLRASRRVGLDIR